MKQALIVISLCVAGLVGFIWFLAFVVGLNFGIGFLNVEYTKTVGKAQKNADREVYEQTTSYVNGKRQEALKYFNEYRNATTIEDKKAIMSLVEQSFAEFDENKLNGKIKIFVTHCKYNDNPLDFE